MTEKQDGIQAIIEKLRITQNNPECWKLIQELDAAEDRYRATEPLIQMLYDKNLPEITRSWAATGLGHVGSRSAEDELIKSFTQENSTTVRKAVVNALDRFRSRQVIDTLIKALSDADADVRTMATKALGKLRAKEAIPRIAEMIRTEEWANIITAAAVSLGKMNDPLAVEPLLDALQRDVLAPFPYVHLDIVKALTELADLTKRADPTVARKMGDVLTDHLQHDKTDEIRQQSAKVLGILGGDATKESLVKALNDPDRVVRWRATEAIQEIFGDDKAARYLANAALQIDDYDHRKNIADALRLIGGMDAIHYLQTIRGDPTQESRAQTLLELIGGRQAINVLIERRIEALTQAESRVKDFDNQALTIFKDTVEEAKRGFITILWMSRVIFVIGVALLGVSIYLIMQPDPSLSQQLFGVGGGLAGLGSILTMFYKAPLERIQGSVANLVQIEIAFLGYIRQVTQITAVFEREYLDNEDFGLTELRKLLGYVERVMKETMLLVNRYTVVSSDRTEEEETDKK